MGDKPGTDEPNMDGEAVAVTASTHFVFEHPVFRAPGVRFLLSNGVPSMAIDLGGADGIVGIRAMLAEFRLTNTPDNAMMDTVAAALRFVRIIRPGDSIPREVLDGTASWSVLDRHVDLARSRLGFQIAVWLKGETMIMADDISLLEMANDPQVKSKIQVAMSELAVSLELQATQVVDRVELVARELAYIEALRERAGVLAGLFEKVAAFTKVFRRERALATDLARILSLMRRPIQDLGHLFEQVDAHCGEIIAALPNYTSLIDYIRVNRDTIHQKLMLWDEIVLTWDGLTVERTVENEREIRLLYAFIARHFSVAKEWQLSSNRFGAMKSKPDGDASG